MELPKDSGSSSDLYEETPTVSHLWFLISKMIVRRYWRLAMGVFVYLVHEDIVLVHRTHEHTTLHSVQLGIADVVWKYRIVRSGRFRPESLVLFGKF